jgi:N-acetylneuraminic acid mutarotase
MYHSAIRLVSGKVLVTGGFNANANTYYATTEVYDPIANVWASAGSMTWARVGHKMTLLTSGKVLVEGGHNGTTYHTAVSLYTP